MSATSAVSRAPAALIRACMEEIEASYDLFAVLARGYAAAIKRARQGVRGPLAGVPTLVSDTLDTVGLTTTLGSWIYRDRIPERSAAAVERLEQAGAIVIGKANVDEFGWGVTGENPHWGFAANPLRHDLVSGGACGGAAAGLAARVCALALGSDADGGLRVPAACCRTVAFKPASGRVERRGSLPLAPSFDAIGPMARSVRDCAVAYSVLVGGPVARPRVQGIRVGVLGAVPAIDGLESLGAVVEEIDLPRPRTRVLPAFLLECGLSRLSDYRERREQLGAGTRALWDAARSVPAIDGWEARQALAEWQQRARTDPPVDLILTPTLGAPVPPRYPDTLAPVFVQRHRRAVPSSHASRSRAYTVVREEVVVPRSRNGETMPKEIFAVFGVDIDAVGGWLGSYGGEDSPSDIQRGMFSGEVGTPRVLKLFQKHNIPASWFIPGHSIETFPDSVKMIVDAGHEIGAHGYSHENPIAMSPKQEEDVLARCVELIEKVSGRPPRGYVAPWWEMSNVTAELLLKYGFTYDHSQGYDDFTPFYARVGDQWTKIDYTKEAGEWMKPLVRGEEIDLVEIGANWYVDDLPPMMFIKGSPNSHGFVNPRHIEEMWRDQFDWVYANMDYAVFAFTIHPDVSGRPQVLLMLERLIGHLNQHAGVKWVTMEQAADDFRRRQPFKG